MTISFSEYWIEYYFFGEIITNNIVKALHLILALCLLMIAHTFRIGALFTAKSNFNHKIQFERHDDH